MVDERFSLPQAPADGRRSRDVYQRAEILHEDLVAIARVADPADSVEDITSKLREEGQDIPKTTVYRRLCMMDQHMREEGHPAVPQSRSDRTPRAGRVARAWAKYAL